MWDWIKRQFGRGFSGLADLANEIRNALTNLVNSFIATFVSWVSAALYLFQASVNFVVALSSLLVSLVNWALRATFVYFPRAVAQAVGDAFTWTEKRYADAIGWINRRIADVIAWAAQLYNDLRSWAVGQVAAIIDWIHNIATLLNDVAKRVYALLTNPRALADWVAGEIIGALYRWALGAAEALGRLFFRFAVSAAIKFADVVEQVIADIFL